MAGKPVKLTAGTNPTAGVTPQEFVVVGGVPVTTAEFTAALKAISGYSAGTAQTLQHNTSGNLVWVNNP